MEDHLSIRERRVRPARGLWTVTRCATRFPGVTSEVLLPRARTTFTETARPSCVVPSMVEPETGAVIDAITGCVRGAQREKRVVREE